VKKSFDDQIDELDEMPAKDPSQFWARTPMAKYLETKSFFGKRYIRWRYFNNKSEREQWEQMEKDYADETIKKKMEWAIQHVPPNAVINAIVKSLYGYVKPDRPEPGTTWESMEKR